MQIIQKFRKSDITEIFLLKKTEEILGFKPEYPKHTEELYKLLSEYIRRDVVFEKRTLKTAKGEIAFSLNKGLFLISSPGSGKSFIFEDLLKTLFPNTTAYVTTYELQNYYTRFGYEALTEWFHSVLRYQDKAHYNLYIDDFGRESKSCKHWGNDIPFMDHVIDQRIRSMRKFGTLTHGSSNLNISSLKEYYSKPTFSRLTALFNFVIINAEGLDFRLR